MHAYLRYNRYVLEVALALTVPGLTGSYYETMWLDRDGAQPALTRVDAELDFDWRFGGVTNGADYPGPFVGAQSLSHSRYVGARWTGLVASEHDEEYTFAVDVPPHHQVRVKVDGAWVVQHWNETGGVRLDSGDASAVADGALSGTYLMRRGIL
jgi:hypothetical protein